MSRFIHETIKSRNPSEPRSSQLPAHIQSSMELEATAYVRSRSLFCKHSHTRTRLLASTHSRRAARLIAPMPPLLSVCSVCTHRLSICLVARVLARVLVRVLACALALILCIAFEYLPHMKVQFREGVSNKFPPLL